MRDKSQALLASLRQRRDTLVKLRTWLKNEINNILSAHGINLEKEVPSSEKKLQEILAMRFDPTVKIELEVIVKEIRSLSQRIANLEKAIADEGSKLEGHKNPTSVKGIGPLTGSILLAVIGDINDFEDEGKLAAYFGIVPRVSKLKETEHTGRITKRGSKLARRGAVRPDRAMAQPVSQAALKLGLGRARRSSRGRRSFWGSSTERSRTRGVFEDSELRAGGGGVRCGSGRIA